jgi:hypothetical protein
MKISIIIYSFNWKLVDNQFPIKDGMYFEKFSTSQASLLYKELCKQLQIDDGDPRNIGTHIVIEEKLLDEVFPYWHTPNSIISKICNILTFCKVNPLTSYRIITSKDDFKNTWTYPLEIHSEYNLYEELTMNVGSVTKIVETLSSINRIYNEDYDLTLDCLNKVKTCYCNLEKLYENKRIKNAFDFFFNAWHSHQMEHICINLAIVLESLFSPNSNTELTHQIAFNTSHFLGNNADEKEKIYALIKNFYNIRSQIVHGSKPDHYNLGSLTSVVYILCCEILQKLFLNTHIADNFIDKETRNKLFNKWMFA